MHAAFEILSVCVDWVFHRRRMKKMEEVTQIKPKENLTEEKKKEKAALVVRGVWWRTA